MSNHRLIITAYREQIEPEEQTKRSWNLRKENWAGFTSTLSELRNNAPKDENVEDKVQQLGKNITSAAKKNTPRDKRKRYWIPF